MSLAYLFEIDGFGFRPVVEDDLDHYTQLDCDPDVMRFFPGGALSPDELKKKLKKYANDYNEKGYGVFSVFDSQSGEFIGRAGFADVEGGEIEVGYLIMKKYWGKGYATRIVKALLSWANENILKDKIIAFTPVDHAASEKVMQKVGMSYVKKGVMKGVECVIYEYPLKNHLKR